MANNEQSPHFEASTPSGMDTFRAKIIGAIPRFVFAGLMMSSFSMKEAKATIGNPPITSVESPNQSDHTQLSEFENGEYLRTRLEEKLQNCKDSPLCVVKFGRYGTESFLEVTGISEPILIQIDSSAQVILLEYPNGMDNGGMYAAEGPLLSVIDVLKHFLALMGREVI